MSSSTIVSFIDSLTKEQALFVADEMQVATTSYNQ